MPSYPNSYYPPIYPQYAQPVSQLTSPISTPPISNSISNSGLIWVQGESAAKSYLVAPNTTVALWDSENKIIYLKSADASGMPNMKVLEYTVRGENVEAEKTEDVPEFATKSDLASLQKQLNQLREKLDNFNKKSLMHKENNRNEQH